MVKIIIAVDIDDVLADTSESLRHFVNRRTNSNLTKDDYRVPGEYWGYYERVWASHGLVDDTQFADFENELAIDQSQVPLLPGASFAIHELSKKYHIILITSRNAKWENETRKWFKEHLGKDDIEIHLTGHRKADDYKTKGELCRLLGVEILIDDNFGHCQSAVDEGVSAVLFGEYGWHPINTNEIPHCKDWSAVLELLQQ